LKEQGGLVLQRPSEQSQAGQQKIQRRSFVAAQNAPKGADSVGEPRLLFVESLNYYPDSVVQRASARNAAWSLD
jgi:hypothetical protein